MSKVPLLFLILNVQSWLSVMGKNINYRTKMLLLSLCLKKKLRKQNCYIITSASSKKKKSKVHQSASASIAVTLLLARKRGIQLVGEVAVTIHSTATLNNQLFL